MSDKLVNFKIDSNKYELFFRSVRKKYGHGGMKIVFNEFVDDFLAKFEKEERLKQECLPLELFAPQLAPPRIIEDFQHIIRPYMNKSNNEELRHLSNTAYEMQVYSKYCLLADKLKILPFEDRIKQNISFDRALKGLEHMETMGYSSLRLNK